MSRFWFLLVLVCVLGCDKSASPTPSPMSDEEKRVAEAFAVRHVMEEKGWLVRMPEKLSDGRAIAQSTAADVNGARHVVGSLWITEETGDMQKSFFWDAPKGTVEILPIPAVTKDERPFTFIDAMAVADTDVVACNAQRPGTRSGQVYQPSRVAHVWDAKARLYTRLPIPLGMNASAATDICADGRAVVGNVFGGGTVRAAVWEKNPDDRWEVTMLPGTDAYAFGISPNGKYVAGQAVPPKDSPFFVPARWTSKDGQWTVTGLGSRPGIAQAVSDEGVAVGFIIALDGRRLAFESNGVVIPLGVLPDHGESQAFGIARSHIVGYSQEKRRSDGTAGRQRAFVSNREMRQLFLFDTTDARSIHPSGIVCGAYAEHREDPEEESDRAYIFSPPFLKP